MPEPSSNLSQPTAPSPPLIDWSIRTMADDLAALKEGALPRAKIIPGGLSDEPHPDKASSPLGELSEGVSGASTLSSPAAKPPAAAASREPAAEPTQRPTPLVVAPAPPGGPQERTTPLPPVQVQALPRQGVTVPAAQIQGPQAPPSPTALRPLSGGSLLDRIPVELRRYLMPGGAGVITIIIAVLVIVGFKRAAPQPIQPTPTPSPAIEGVALNETPSISPIVSPTPSTSTRQSPLKGDSQEIVTATSQTVAQVLSAIALKTRPPRQLTELTFPGLTPEDLSRSLLLDSLLAGPAAATSTPSSTTTPPRLFLYFHTQEERFSTTTHPTRLVALLQGVPVPTEATRHTIESTLLAIKDNLSLGIPGTVQATLGFQETLFSGIPVRYLNFPDPDITLDYAFVAERSTLVIATSREAMFAVLGRLVR